MKRKIKLLLIVVAVIPGAVFARKLAPEVEHAMAYGAEAKICLKVCDDVGQPVTNASVAVVFDMLPRPHSVYGKTDSNGICVAEGKTNGNKIRFLVGKDGYYGSQKEVSYVTMNEEHDVKAGKWQPYGDKETILLRPIKSPLKLSSVMVKDYKFTSAICEWIGYDLERNDFVKPHGFGEVSDFEVYLDWDRVYSLNCQRIGFKIRFTEPRSGFYSVPIEDTSEFPVPYKAARDRTFLQDAEFYDRQDGKRLRNTFDKSKCWIIQSRCKVDQHGRLVAANYSVARFLGISGSRDLKAGFSFVGAFNPTPNDTNLEDEEFAKQSRHFIRYCEPPGKGNLKTWGQTPSNP